MTDAARSVKIKILYNRLVALMAMDKPEFVLGMLEDHALDSMILALGAGYVVVADE